MLPLNLSDTAATSQDGSSLEFIAPIGVGSAIFRMQVAEGCGKALKGGQANKQTSITLHFY